MLTASLIRMDVAQGYSEGEVGGELTGVARIDGELIGVRYAEASSRGIPRRELTHGEVAERSTDSLGVVIPNAEVASCMHQCDVAYQTR